MNQSLNYYLWEFGQYVHWKQKKAKWYDWLIELMKRIDWSSAMHMHGNDCVYIQVAWEVQVLSDSDAGYFHVYSWCAICWWYYWWPHRWCHMTKCYWWSRREWHVDCRCGRASRLHCNVVILTVPLIYSGIFIRAVVTGLALLLKAAAVKSNRTE